MSEIKFVVVPSEPYVPDKVAESKLEEFKSSKTDGFICASLECDGQTEEEKSLARIISSGITYPVLKTRGAYFGKGYYDESEWGRMTNLEFLLGKRSSRKRFWSTLGSEPAEFGHIKRADLEASHFPLSEYEIMNYWPLYSNRIYDHDEFFGNKAIWRLLSLHLRKQPHYKQEGTISETYSDLERPEEDCNLEKELVEMYADRVVGGYSKTWGMSNYERIKESKMHAEKLGLLGIFELGGFDHRFMLEFTERRELPLFEIEECNKESLENIVMAQESGKIPKGTRFNTLELFNTKSSYGLRSERMISVNFSWDYDNLAHYEEALIDDLSETRLSSVDGIASTESMIPFESNMEKTFSVLVQHKSNKKDIRLVTQKVRRRFCEPKKTKLNFDEPASDLGSYRIEKLTMFFIALILMAKGVKSSSSDDLHVPEYCVDDNFSPAPLFVHYNQFKCNALGLNPVGAPLDSKACLANALPGYLFYSWGSGPLNRADQLDNLCYTSLVPNKSGYQIKNGTSNTVAFWHCLDISTPGLSSLRCENKCSGENKTEVEVRGCYSSDSSPENLAYNQVMRPTESLICPSDVSDPSCPEMECLCGWRCFDQRGMLKPYSDFENDFTNVDQSDQRSATLGAGDKALLLPICSDIRWRRVLLISNISTETFEIFINFKEGFLYVKATPSGSFQTLVSKGKYQAFFDFAGTDYRIEVPKNALLDSGTLSVSVFNKGKMVGSKDIDIIGFSSCDLKDCLTCDVFANFNCLPPTIKGFLIATLVVLCLVLITAFPLLLAGLMLLIKVGFAIIKMIARFFKMLAWNKFTKRAYINLKDSVSEEKKLAEMELEEGLKMSEMAKKKMRVNPLMMCVALFMICSVEKTFACENGAVIPVKLESCNMSGNKETCSVEFETILSLAQPGSKTCLTIMDESRKIVFGQINVTLEAVQQQSVLTTRYYTSDYETHTQSHHICYSINDGDFCPTGCGNVNENPTSPLGTYGSDVILQDTLAARSPGRASCRRVSGCAWNGCGWCSDACVVSRIGIVPSGKVAEVFNKGPITTRAIASVSLRSEAGEQFMICSELGKPCFLSDFSLTIDNVNSQITGTFQEDIVKWGDLTFLATANEKDDLSSGTIGEIQAVSEASLKANLFNFGELWNFVENGFEDEYLVQQSALTNLAGSTSAKLPAVISGLYWEIKSGKLISNSSEGSSQMRISTLRPISVSRIVNIVCPKIKSATASGCSSCEQGFEIKLDASSECSEGLVSVKTDDTRVEISTKSIRLGAAVSSLKVRAQTPVESNKFNLILEAGQNSDKIEIVFDAPSNVSLRNDSWVSTHTSSIGAENKVSVPSTDFNADFFERSLMGHGSALEIGVTVAIFAVVAIFGTVLVLLIERKTGVLRRIKIRLLTRSDPLEKKNM